MITLLGAGFLGSLFAEELAKRLFALDLTEQVPWRIVDFDEVEARNCANQLYTPREAGFPKALVLAERLGQYGLRAAGMPERLTDETADALLAESTLIVSATDNMAARNCAWYYAVGQRIPLLHLGISQDGTGNVEWTVWDEYDSWILSPIALKGRPAPPDPVRRFRPCELVGFRGLGLNTAIAGAKSACIFHGNDPEQTLGKGRDVEPGVHFVSWLSEQCGHSMQDTYTLNPVEATI